MHMSGCAPTRFASVPCSPRRRARPPPSGRSDSKPPLERPAWRAFRPAGQSTTVVLFADFGETIFRLIRYMLGVLSLQSIRQIGNNRCDTARVSFPMFANTLRNSVCDLGRHMMRNVDSDRRGEHRVECERTSPDKPKRCGRISGCSPTDSRDTARTCDSLREAVALVVSGPAIARARRRSPRG